MTSWINQSDGKISHISTPPISKGFTLFDINATFVRYNARN
jgi:hypothetical protein